MKLIRFGNAGAEKPGVILPNGHWIDTSSFIEDYNAAFFSGNGLQRLQDWVADAGGDAPEISVDTRLGPPIAHPGKLICIGLNYEDHARETGSPLPGEPILFFKATSAINGPHDDVIIPRGSEKTDWEVELAVVIGKKASYVSEQEAMQCVAGYVLHNDYSERAFQLERGGQWVKGKSCDTFAPLGPYLATPDEVGDVHNLRLWLKVNGEMKQESNSANLIFKIPYLVSYISNFMSLHPGDIISTGTPPGVGLGLKPPQFLKDGDVVELGIEGLGTQKQKLRAFQPAGD
jgi:2-keto-4-pentenoate hydratase/2-oxohepta-3-ene-1,7-dioic acid hydratase in catechol pathway